MLTKWRSLVVTGVMLSALVLFGATTALAQITPGTFTITAAAGDHGEIDVAWAVVEADPANPVIEGVEIRHAMGTSITADTASITLTDVGNANSYTITGLDHGTAYTVQARVYDRDAETEANRVSAWATASGSPVTTKAAENPDQVDDLELEAGDGMIMAMWDEGDGNGFDITGYKLEIMPMGGAWNVTHVGAVTEHTFTGLMNGTEYSVRVSAMSEIGTGTASSVEKAKPMEAPPAPLTAPMVTLEAGDGMIMASWGAVEGADSYKVSWTAGGVTASATVMMGTSYTIENLMNGTAYSVMVSAMMGGMEGPASTAQMATPMPATDVPALPLFGMLALGAGLVAAGRRRLHAQRLLKN